MSVQPSEYFGAASRLSQYAAVNRADTEFAQAGGEIVYLFDTSILEAYWRNQPRDIAGAFGIERLFTAPAASMAGLLTLQYLVEGSLPGMRGHAFMSTPHWNEALARASRLARRVRHESGGQIADRASLDRLLFLLEEHRSEPEAMIRAAEEARLGETLSSLSAAVSYNGRLRSTFAEGRGAGRPGVRDVSYSEYWTAAADAIGHTDFARWYAAISAARPATGPRAAETANANRNDALTFAAIRAMARENLAAGGVAPTLRFVFVTADRALHVASQTMLADLQRDGLAAFIRHPHVYTPILNLSNMAYQQDLSNADRLELRQVFEQVELTLETLFSVKASPDRVAERASVLQLRRNIGRWSRVSDRLRLVNSTFMLSDVPDKPHQLDAISKLLSAADVREAVAGMLADSIARIREDHVQGVSALALDRLAAAASRKSESSTGSLHRAPVKLLDVDVLSAIGIPLSGRRSATTWLDTLLVRIRSGKEPELLDDVVRKIRIAWSDPARMAPAHLLASCLYFAVGAWDSARLCAQLCRQKLTGAAWRSVWMREARYCEALATRMRLISAMDVENAHKGLTDNLADYTDPLAQARDRVERATLMLDAAVSQSIDDVTAPAHDAEPLPELVAPEALRNYFDKAVVDLRKVLEGIDSFDLSGFEQPAVRIRLQAEINMVGAMIFKDLLGERVSADRHQRTDLAQALADLELSMAEYEAPLTPTGEIYRAVGLALIGGDGMVEAAKLLLSEREKATERSRADQLEGAFLSNAMLQLAG